MNLEQLKKRKGAVRIADIPPHVLSALNMGQFDTKNLVEWLAVDIKQLLVNVLPNVGLTSDLDNIIRKYKKLEKEGITKRVKGVGSIIYNCVKNNPSKEDIFESMALYPSDMIRSFSAYSTIWAVPDMDLSDRLQLARRFAIDPSISVRECAWDCFRPYIEQELERAVELLCKWVFDESPNIRRCAVESTRPRGVWTSHIRSLRQNPQKAIMLLEPLKNDKSRYVQNSVANWLNDASKDNPEWVKNLCKDWKQEPMPIETEYIIKRGMRTLNS